MGKRRHPGELTAKNIPREGAKKELVVLRGANRDVWLTQRWKPLPLHAEARSREEKRILIPAKAGIQKKAARNNEIRAFLPMQKFWKFEV